MDQSYQPLELKSLAEDGTFEGLGATYGKVDSQAIASSLARSKRPTGSRCLCYSRTRRMTCRRWHRHRDAARPLGEGKLLLDTVAGREAYTRAKAGLLKALSVGFKLPADGFTLKSGVRSITRGVLKEISLVVFGANDRAAILAVKEESQSSPLVSLRAWL